MNPFDLKQLGLDVEYPYRQQYDNYIGGKWVPPVKGEYFENVSPINGQPFCRIRARAPTTSSRARRRACRTPQVGQDVGCRAREPAAPPPTGWKRT